VLLLVQLREGLATRRVEVRTDVHYIVLISTGVRMQLVEEGVRFWTVLLANRRNEL